MYPFGAVGGYLSVSLFADLHHKFGFPVTLIAALNALSFVPNTWKFLWAPVIDSTLTPRIWYTGSALLGALATIGLALAPTDQSALLPLQVMIFLSSLAVTFTGMSADAIAARTAPPDEKGRFGGWMQIGNLAGGGVGGGIALLISQRAGNQWIPAAVVALSMACCPIALLYVPRLARLRRDHSLGQELLQVVRDCWSLVTSRSGFLTILVLFLPLGTGAASGLWSVVNSDWGASLDDVALSTGIWSGVCAAVGCLIAAPLCDRLDRKWAYALFGLVQAACCIAMAVAPHSRVFFIGFALLYSVITGFNYTSFSALSLEVVNERAAATQYNLLASLSNVPIMYMGLLDGYGHEQWGATGMLLTEAVVGIAAVVLFIAVRQWVDRRGTQGVSVPA